jgi:hypothetical protein
MSQSRRRFLTGCAAAGAAAAVSPRLAAEAAGGESPAVFVRPEAIDIDPIVDAALAAVSAARLGPGRYSRFLGEQRTRRPRGGELNSYGCAAAACVLYATDHFPRDAAERAAFVETMQANQAADTGLFSEPSHHAWHSTAYVPAALALFDARPIHPLKALHPLLEPGGIEQLLDSLDWLKAPWPAAHRGAGSFAALYLADEATPGWQERYFSWMWDNADERTGLWRKGCPPPSGGAEAAPFFHHLASSFHYVFNHVIVHRPLRYPEAMIDSALRVRKEKLTPLAQGPGFSEIDWVYCLTRPLRQCGHRFAEVHAEVADFAQSYAKAMLAYVASKPTPFEDLHALNGTMAAFAELQQAVPGLLRTKRPLRLILDRRPFI